MDGPALEARQVKLSGAVTTLLALERRPFKRLNDCICDSTSKFAPEKRIEGDKGNYLYSVSVRATCTIITDLRYGSRLCAPDGASLSIIVRRAQLEGAAPLAPSARQSLRDQIPPCIALDSLQDTATLVK